MLSVLKKKYQLQREKYNHFEIEIEIETNEKVSWLIFENR